MSDTDLYSAEQVHPLHSHLLLYSGPVDSQAARHALQGLQAVLGVHPRFSCCFAVQLYNILTAGWWCPA